MLCSCSKGELQRRSNGEAAWLSWSSLPQKRPHERWHLPLWSFVLAVSHGSWPTWFANDHIFEPTPVFPGLIHIPAGLWLGWYLASIWGLGERPMLPPSGCPLLDRDGRPTKRPTAKSGQRASSPLLNFATMSPRSRETHSTLPLLLPRWDHLSVGVGEWPA